MTVARKVEPVVGVLGMEGDSVKSDVGRTPGQPAPPISRALLAVHEAAHAVAAVRVGIGVARVSIDRQMVDATLAEICERDPRADGICLLSGTPAPPDADFRDSRRWPSLENEIAVGLAAAAAEARALGIAVFTTPSWPSEYALAARLAARRGIPRAEVRGFVNWLLERADRLVDIWWSDICLVAELLEREGTIDGPRLHATLSTPRHRAIAASCDGRLT